VVDEGGDEDAEDHGAVPPAVARSEHERQQLRLVAHLREGDDSGGHQEGFQGRLDRGANKEG
jgi:hypothetical protein